MENARKASSETSPFLRGYVCHSNSKISGDAKAWHDSIEKKLQRVKQLRETLPTLFKHGTSFRDIMAVRLVETQFDWKILQSRTTELVMYIMEGETIDRNRLEQAILWMGTWSGAADSTIVHTLIAV